MNLYDVFCQINSNSCNLIHGTSPFKGCRLTSNTNLGTWCRRLEVGSPFVFNEAEALAAVAQATLALEDGAAGDDALDVAGHKRLKRGRKPLDADLPRRVVRHELP